MVTSVPAKGLKIAILTPPDFLSPRVLADSLKCQLIQEGVDVEVIYDMSLLKRLVHHKLSKLRFHFWLKNRLKFFIHDYILLHRLKKFDAVIISDSCPNSFFNSLYNMQKFKKKINIPIGFYEVYYLENAPTQIDFLKKNKCELLERFDFYFSVSRLTEIKKEITDKWYPIGIVGESWQLKPTRKNEIIAIIDFVYPGNEKIRACQIHTLKRLGIKYVSLERPYTIQEIRALYQNAAIYLMQSPEAFGVPIVECLSSGCQIFTLKSAWPMSWRLNENPQIHEDGVLPDCFTVYQNEQQLESELHLFIKNYDLDESPKRIFQTFVETYPQFYYGDQRHIQRFLKDIKDQKD